MATNAYLYIPTAVAFDSLGNMFIADFYNNRIRKVNTSGYVSTYAGNGGSFFTGWCVRLS